MLPVFVVLFGCGCDVVVVGGGSCGAVIVVVCASVIVGVGMCGGCNHIGAVGSSVFVMLWCYG